MESTEKNWDRMARAYEDFTSGPDSYSSTVEWPCVRAMLPGLAGKSVLDLGCGTGRFTFLLEAEKPGFLMGVDLSAAMLELARSKAGQEGSRAVFVKADLLAPFTERTFDFIFSSTVTHYIPDLDRFFARVYDLLAPGGECLLSVLHPVYSAQYPTARGDALPGDDEWQVRYLDRRERAYVQPWIEHNDGVEDFLSHSFHHIFSDYVNAALRSRLSILEAREPAPPEAWMARCPRRYEAFLETPSYLILKLGRS